MNTPLRKLLNTLLTSFTLILILSFQNLLGAANIEDGSKLFKANCAVCHSLGTNKITGPGLEGVTERVPMPYQDWMLKWIKNNNAVRESGNAYANQVFADNHGVSMTVFEGTLNDDQIKSIIAFLAHPPKSDSAANAEILESEGVNKVAQDNSGSHLWIWGIVLGIFLVLVLILRSIRKLLLSAIHKKNGESELEDTSIWQDTKRWIYNHKTKFAVICFFLCALSSVYAWEYMWDVHVTPGYHPSQPINFIHKVHAGDNAIACLYCHSGAEKGKVAGIPTLNVCMNCHKGIQGSNPEYQKEIAKIYYAVGWDVAKGDYTNPPHPIHWNRVNSIPDFAYFNHAQHVVVGKIACQKCHGDCSTYTTNLQFAPLTMGWCINCHRETPVQMEGNGYYTKLHKAITKNFGEDRKITEADMGGMECNKCHY